MRNAADQHNKSLTKTAASRQFFYLWIYAAAGKEIAGPHTGASTVENDSRPHPCDGLQNGRRKAQFAKALTRVKLNSIKDRKGEL